MELSAPSQLRHCGANKYYFRLQREGDDEFLVTNRFYSHGPFKSPHNKLAMFVSKESGVLDKIHKITAECKEKLACPEGLDWNLDEAWKPYSPAGMFITLSDNFQAFNREKKAISNQKLGKGFYVLRLHVPGVFLGEQANGPLASLTVKVLQAVFEPEEENSVCMI